MGPLLIGLVVGLALILLANPFWSVINFPNGGFVKPLVRLGRRRLAARSPQERRALVYTEWTKAETDRVRNKMLQRKEDRFAWQQRWEELAPRETYPFTLPTMYNHSGTVTVRHVCMGDDRIIMSFEDVPMRTDKSTGRPTYTGDNYDIGGF